MSQIDPYKSPESAMGDDKSPAEIPAVRHYGRPCPSCGSDNTGKSGVAGPRPNLLFVILFGWWFLLLRGAFGKRTDLCHDCGALNRYKSFGSWIALLIVVVLIAFLVWGIFLAED